MESRSQFGVVEVEPNLISLPSRRKSEHAVVGVGLQHITVGDVGVNVNHGFVGACFDDVVLLVEFHLNDHRQSVHARSERAQVISQFGR